jgi:hypothetical protein
LTFYNNTMPKRDEEDSVVSETGNWNVADDYSKKKIMYPLYLCDIYEDIATFGYESIIDELINFEAPPNDIIRIKGLQRLIHGLIRIIDNSKFALKKPGTRDEILKYRKILSQINHIIPLLIKKNYNQLENTQTLNIWNPKLLDLILEKVSKIKSKINEPLNKNHLIFTDKEEFDPKAFKDRLKARMINQG